MFYFIHLNDLAKFCSDKHFTGDVAKNPKAALTGN